eukprot:scaffold36000_cov60-Phaeocystis_antarctica.AAC.1
MHPCAAMQNPPRVAPRGRPASLATRRHCRSRRPWRWARRAAPRTRCCCGCCRCGHARDEPPPREPAPPRVTRRGVAL